MTRFERELALFDEYQRRTRERFVAGEVKYGMDWSQKNNLAEALEEIEDIGNYFWLQWLKVHHLAALDSEPPRIYVSGPYTNGDRAANIAAAADVARACMLRGWVPFCPHTMTAGWEADPRFGYDDFMRIALAWLRRCNAIVMCGDWLSSDGALKERQMAQQWGLTVYDMLADVPDLGTSVPETGTGT